jgi:cytochrome c oxidase subunit 2
MNPLPTMTSVDDVTAPEGEHMTHHRRVPRLAVAGALALAGLVLAGCAEDAPQDTFQPEGSQAETIDNLARPVFYIAGFVGVLVAVAVIVAIVKFRDRPERGEGLPEQSHGKPALEISLTILPALLLATIGVFTVSTIFELADTPDEPFVIQVTGQQWWWEFSYPELVDEQGHALVTSGEMIIPAGEEVLLKITSRDVIHSFWIPRLNGKKDAVPNRVHDLTMQANEPGEYWGQCAEYCGLSHANMRMRVVALDDAGWDTWVSQQLQPAAVPEEEMALAGQETFIAQCSRCHQVNGLTDAEGAPIIPDATTQLVAGAAPNLTHLMSRTTFAGGTFDLKLPECTNDPAFDAEFPTGTAENCLNEADLERWLRNAPAMKPMYADPDKTAETDGLLRGMPALGLTESQINELVAYLKTLT